MKLFGRVTFEIVQRVGGTWYVGASDCDYVQFRRSTGSKAGPSKDYKLGGPTGRCRSGGGARGADHDAGPYFEPTAELTNDKNTLSNFSFSFSSRFCVGNDFANISGKSKKIVENSKTLVRSISCVFF